jgi:hypothetical protein
MEMECANKSGEVGLNGFDELDEPGSRVPNRVEPRRHTLDSSQPGGVRSPSALPPFQSDSRHFQVAASQPERALATTAPSGERRTGLQRAAGALRAALPFVQRILPLLDGNIGTAVSNVMGPYPHMAPPPPPVNLEPLQEDLAELQAQHRDLRNRILEQKSQLKRVEDQLETVRETADRNAQEQQDILDDLKAVRKKVNVFAALALTLLILSVAANVVLYLHIVHLIP